MADQTVRPIFPEDWAFRLEADYDAYMNRLYESVEGDPVEDSETLDASGTYFCGCSVCERRAAWTFLMIRFIEASREGLITLEKAEAP